MNIGAHAYWFTINIILVADFLLITLKMFKKIKINEKYIL